MKKNSCRHGYKSQVTHYSEIVLFGRRLERHDSTSLASLLHIRMEPYKHRLSNAVHKNQTHLQVYAIYI